MNQTPVSFPQFNNPLTVPPSVAALTQEAQNPMAMPLPDLMKGAAPTPGVANPPNMNELTPREDQFARKTPEMPQVKKKGSPTSVLLVAQGIVFTIGAVYFLKSSKNLASKIWQFLKR